LGLGPVLSKQRKGFDARQGDVVDER